MRSRQPLRLLPKRIWISFRSLVSLIYFRPAYLALAAVASIVFYEIIFWLLNIGLFHYLMTSPFLTLSDRLDIFIGSYTNVFSLPLAPLSTTLFVVSILQGITAAAIVYSIRRERQMGEGLLKGMSGTGLAGVLSAVGFGCVACGTSLITPILTFFFATSSAVVAEKVGLYSMIFALVASLVAAYFAGYRLSARLSHPVVYKNKGKR